MDWGLAMGAVGAIGIPVAIGLTMAATTPGEFRFVRGCFIVAAFLTVASVVWLTHEQPLGWIKLAGTGFVGAVVAISLVVALDWVGRKQAMVEIPIATQSEPAPIANAPILEHSPAPIVEAPIAPPSAIVLETSTPDVPPNPPRIFVDPNVTPEFLIGLYEGNTTLRAETLISEEIGKWMQVSGPLGEIHAGRIIGESQRSPTLVAFSSNTRPTIYMWFSSEWVERLARLPKGQNITVIGQIEKVTLYNTTVELKNCELVDPDPLPSAPARAPDSPARPRRRRSSKGKQS